MRIEALDVSELAWASARRAPVSAIPDSSRTIAVVGAGPWGLAVLDRLIGKAGREPGGSWNILLIDPQPPGFGVHSRHLSDLLLLNTVNGQIDSFGASTFGERPVAGSSSFLEWLASRGQTPVEASGFVPRRLFGRYLGFVYDTLRRATGLNLRLQYVQREVVDIGRSAREEVVLDDGSTVQADMVILCTGHGVDAVRGRTSPDTDGGRLSPYPVDALADDVAPRAVVGLEGLGLVAVDVVAALAEGRGGRYLPAEGGGLTYVPSGREPTIHLFSRGGLPFCCRPVPSLERPGGYQPVVCTSERIAERRADTPDGRLDFERDVLPLLFEEMKVIYRQRSNRGSMVPVLNPKELFYGLRYRTVDTAEAYRSMFVNHLRHDVGESLKGEAASPYKAALECFRLLRDTIRAAVEFGGLTSASHGTFRRWIAPRINQIAVGPPLVRGAQLIALVEAGIVRLDLGPAPQVTPVGQGVWQASSSRFRTTASVRLDAVVRGFLNGDQSVRSSRLFQALKASGRARAAISNHDDTILSDLDISENHALVDARGRPQTSIRVLGMPCEGMTYFNHYLPSPGSRSRAFRTIENILESIVRQRRHA